MTENPGQSAPLPEPEWYKNPPSWWNQPQRQTAPYQSPDRQSSYQGGPSNNDIFTALKAMPEQVVNAIREATQAVQAQQAAQPPAPPAQQQAQQEQPRRDERPASLSFAERWFAQGPGQAS